MENELTDAEALAACARTIACFRVKQEAAKVTIADREEAISNLSEANDSLRNKLEAMERELRRHQTGQTIESDFITESELKLLARVEAAEDKARKFENDSIKLECLRNAGVDNWDGWEYACEEYDQINSQKITHRRIDRS